jgi:hypothetical protein
MSGLTFRHYLDLTLSDPGLSRHCLGLGMKLEIGNQLQRHFFSILAFVHRGAHHNRSGRMHAA